VVADDYSNGQREEVVKDSLKMHRYISQNELAFEDRDTTAAIVIVDDYRTRSRGARLPKIMGYAMWISVLTLIELERFFFIFCVRREPTKHSTRRIEC
jgi:hypothetical protein